ncbi:hypothetical protein PspLS_06472, partial [Pyricularia sp. CBS 133598]
QPIIRALAEVTSHKAVRWDSLPASLQRHTVGEGATIVRVPYFWRKEFVEKDGRKKIR